MSDKTTILYNALWIAHPLIQGGIAAVLLRRGLHRQFKCFFAYIIAQILTFSLIFPSYVSHNYPAYFYLYWTTNAVGVLLGFLVIHEVFLDVFRPFHTLRDLGTVLFKWAGLVMLLVAGVVSISANSSDLAPWMQAIVTAERCVRIVQVGMVLLLLFFSRYLGTNRRQLSFGIALGFGFFAMVELGLIAFWSGGHMNQGMVNLINIAAYNASLLIWFRYSVLKSPARETSSTLLQPQRWEQSLTDIHHPLPPDSLIPMFEGMVDRALLKTQSPAGSGNESRAAAAAAAPGGTSSVNRLNMGAPKE
ncbi:MAG TPA: hypothetical protein VIH89_03830 [Candidatus Sulfotelmatobacter sp.]|jgi:hypothetical protein